MSHVLGPVWWLIVTLGLLITFHEYGHYIVARRLGVKVLKFSVGFGPALWSRFDRHGTQFVIAAIPLGGYVKMLDTREVDGAVGPEGLRGAFDRKPVGARMAITAAGPVFNFIFTIAALWLVFVIGRPDFQPVVGSVDHVAASSGFQAGDRIIAVGGRAVDAWTTALGALMSAGIDRRDVVVDVVDAGGSARQRTLALSKLPADVDERQLPVEIGLAPPRQPIPPVIGSVPADGAAAKAGLAPGDRILSIGGDAIKDWRDVPDAIQKHASAGHALDITVERDGGMRSFAVTPAQGDPDPADAAAKPRWLVGIGVQPVEPNFDATLRYGPVAALGKAFSETWNQTHDLLGLLGRMVTGQASVKNLGGVISIAQAADSNAKGGLVWFLTFLAAISLSLAVLNLLPIPILDGGGLLYYLIESIKGSPLSDRVQIAGQYVGLVLLVGLMGLALYNDILRNVS
ncbi:RIP metalloprotease RseP [Dokdonella fugitiva]|uniref:Zinc metalloprotease n=1 Tax=Dokdonella fugitiva TaxID=328517 RepID=A0A4V2S218_9GAMM|nr:RIP metalloprotease RseP [Dokdonella fugitiva]TCO38760.1 regulator of sigma E protease [Dokdonella fugitiva]